MPVQTDDFDWRVVLRRETSGQRNFDEPDQQAGADDHVQGVQAGHAKVERKIELRVGLDVRVSKGCFVKLFSFIIQVFFFYFGFRFRVVDLIPDVEAVPGKQMVVEFLLVLDYLNAKKHGPEA